MLEFPTIETGRLALRVLTLDDADAVFTHFSDDDVTRLMDTESCTCLDDAKEIILFHQRDSGCRWGLFDKVTGRLAGTCGYHCWEKGPGPYAEIGYDLAKAYWGRGLMREALLAVIPFGFTVMQLQRIEASVHPQNERSMAVLSRLGFHAEAAVRAGQLWFHLLKTHWMKHNPR